MPDRVEFGLSIPVGGDDRVIKIPPRHAHGVIPVIVHQEITHHGNHHRDTECQYSFFPRCHEDAKFAKNDVNTA